jgi:hypothetical protein
MCISDHQDSRVFIPWNDEIAIIGMIMTENWWLSKHYTEM